jgi:hypothetical protein
MTVPAAALGLPAGTERELRTRLYAALALALASAPRPAVALIETSSRSDAATVTVRPPELLCGPRATPAFRPLLRTPTGAADAAVEPPVWGIEWSLEFPGSAGAPVPESGVWDAPELGPLLGPGARLDTQTFWMSGRTDGRFWAARRVRLVGPGTEAQAATSAAVGVAASIEWGRATGAFCVGRSVAPSPRRWSRGSSRSLSRAAWVPVSPSYAGRLAEGAVFRTPPARADDGHAVAMGASGAGKTTFLADVAARAIRRGQAVLALDLHGDLTPAVAGRLDASALERVVAVDAGRRPVVGIAALAGRGDREAEQLVAAVKRLSPDGSELYWGFRLERIFDAFVRLVQESGGTLGDLYALLTDADRRETARLATRSGDLARFLDELAPIVRRNPDFLWSAAARLAKVVLLPRRGELLTPADGGVPVEELLDRGRSLLVRLPFSRLGPEAATFAGSLLLARSYLGLAERRGPGYRGVPTVVVLDEVHGFSPRLVAEMLTEGRKFGLRLVVASQYPERLARELRFAAAGVARTVVAFRVPRASAAEVGGWLGLSPPDALRVLPELPVGLGIARAAGSGELATVLAAPDGAVAAGGAWAAAVRRSAREFPPASEEGRAAGDDATERLLLAVLAAEERGAPLEVDRLVEEAALLPGLSIDPAVLGDRAGSLVRQGLAHPVDGRWTLTPAGERRLGLRTTTGATTESAEHRALLVRAFRLFARRGCRLEIVPQGRYDTTLPDGRLRQIPEAQRGASPATLAATVRAAESSWAWRFFHGQDVHVEAEVSGALRPARIRHGLEKARRRGAFALFVVGDAARAAKVRRTLRAEGATIAQAQVWTLRLSLRSPDDGPERA